MRLVDDLNRAGIYSKWWVINSSFYLTDTKSPLLTSKAVSEVEWINKVAEVSKGNAVLIKWYGKEIQGNELMDLLTF
ncbi:hypothetical protein SDC9_176977 [bioreactor metagenome]|uniref:Uncharacterized protein n=1 Tax=bioreactor metagenome TaxID=1076179 RepID=A0A645GZP2_9ZZZZ